MSARRVSIVSLGCARNDVDSEELAGRLAAEGWTLVEDEPADVVVVNTCTFIETARADSIDAILEAGPQSDGTTAAVVAVGCMAERYGKDLADALPEAAILSFDDYPQISARLGDILSGHAPVPHTPRDRRALLPITPVERPAISNAVPGHGPSWLRRRLTTGPIASLKIASGCDRRCSFCAIPTFRGAFVSRTPLDVLSEARALAEGGVKELILVSENSTSYGKDLGDNRALEKLLPELASIDGIERIRVSYLQPAEMRPSLIETLATTPGVAAYADLSFQHSSASVLRRMRRFGDTDSFLTLIGNLRSLAPTIGIRSNVIVGFPGETDADLAELERFLESAMLDAVGVFGYSDEEGTEAERLEGKLPADVIRERVESVTELADEMSAQRAEDRIGSTVTVLLTSADEGSAEHQGPEDGTTRLVGITGEIGELVVVTVQDSDGVDLIAGP